MTILQLISSEGLYGAENALLTLAAELSRSGCRVIVAGFEDARNPHVEVVRAAQDLGLETRLIPCSGRWDSKVPDRIRAIAAETGAQILHAHGYKADLYALAAARKHPIPLVSTCHNWPDPSLLMQAYARLDRLALRRFSTVTTPSEKVARTLRQSGIGGGKVHVIPNGVDLPRFATAAPTLRQQLPFAADRVIGCVTRLVPAKGGQFLIEAAATVLEQCPGVGFVFAGAGPARAEWEALAARLGVQDRVYFAGERRDMPEVYASFDVLVLPSLEEAMPMCLLEGLAAAKPVVATRVGAIPDVVIPGETGLLVEPGDAQGLAGALLQLLRDPERAISLGRRGREHVARTYSSEAFAARYRDLYSQLAPAPEPRPAPAAKTLDVSLISACRNEAGHIREFVDSILAQDLSGMTWEVLIADGQSDDGTRRILDEYSAANPHLTVISNPRRIVSTGLNAAIRAAKGRILIRLDAHTRYASDYVKTSVATLQRTGADNVGGPARTSAKGPKAQAIAAAYHSRFSTGGARFHDPDYEGWCDTVPYGCWRAETFERIGPFDEDLVRNQDDEFNLRLTRAGGRVWQSSAIRSWYSPRPTLRALFQQYFQYGFWKVAVIRKHRLPGSWRHLVPVAFVMLQVALPAAALLNPLFVAPWLLFLGVYAGANLLASFSAASEQGWETLPYIPAAFVAFHFSYGLGFLAGLLRFSNSRAALPPESVFARLSR